MEQKGQTNPFKHIPLPRDVKGSFNDDSWTEGCHAGIGFFFECAWFDVILASLLFGALLVITQKLSEKMKQYRNLDEEERRDWVLSVANFVYAFISIIGTLTILFDDNWYLDHPKSERVATEYHPALSFFIPWMIGYNGGKVILVLSHFVRALPEANLWDCLPLGFHIMIYSMILDHKIFGMLAVFQMLFECHHIYSSPMNILECTNKKETILYKILNIIGNIYRPITMLFAGPYCLAMLWYHWGQLYEFTGFTKVSFLIIIGINSVFFIADIGFMIYSQFSYLIFGYNTKKYWEDWAKQERKEANKWKRKGYKKIHQNDNEIDQDSDDDDNIQLGNTSTNNNNTTKFE